MPMGLSRRVKKYSKPRVGYRLIAFIGTMYVLATICACSVACIALYGKIVIKFITFAGNPFAILALSILQFYTRNLI